MAQEEWTPRTDASTRKVIERLDTLTRTVDGFDEHLEKKLKGYVSWQGIWASAIALLALVATLVFALNAPVKESSAATRLEMKDARKDLGTEVKELRREFREEVRGLTAEVKAVRSVTVDQIPRAQAKQELQRSKAEER